MLIPELQVSQLLRLAPLARGLQFADVLCKGVLLVLKVGHYGIFVECFFDSALDGSRAAGLLDRESLADFKVDQIVLRDTDIALNRANFIA